ncbi:MAG: PH domain-containing protein [Planctomycetia bacterium]|nr:PH domain-containing protein [Planctomycetia bacterium]
MADWYIYEDGYKRGPITPTMLKTMAEKGQISPLTVVERNGRPVAAGQVHGLFPEPELTSPKQPRQVPVPPPQPAFANVSTVQNVSSDVLFVGRQHWSELILTIIFCTLVFLTGMLIFMVFLLGESDVFSICLGLLLTLVPVAIFLVKYIEWRTTTITITMEIVYLRRLCNRKSIPISHIQSVETSTNFIQSLFGTNSLLILTGGAWNANVFKGSKQAQDAHDLLLKMIKSNS